MSKWVRSGVLVGADDLVRALGGDFRALLQRSGLGAQAVRDPDLPIPIAGFIRFLEEAASALDCDSFGLRLGASQDLSLFGPLQPLLESAGTVGELIRDLAAYFPLHTEGAIVVAEPAPGGLLIQYEIASGVRGSLRQTVELGFGFLVTELRRRQPDWRPAAAQLRHAPPADLRWRRRILGPAVAYNCDRNALFVEDRLLALPLATADRVRHERLAAAFQGRAAAGVDMLRLKTETVVRGLLPSARLDLTAAAALMRMSPRTLQRRLAAAGAGFEAIVNEVRADLAESYLRESALSAAEIAEILQFSQTSAFSRAFRRWRGMSPREARAGAAAP